MIRTSLDSDASNVALLLTPEHGVRFQWRSQADGPSTSFDGGAGAVGMWLRLARSGDTFTASRSDDGLSWSEIGSVEVAISASAYIGLALSSHEPGATTEAASSHR